MDMNSKGKKRINKIPLQQQLYEADTSLWRRYKAKVYGEGKFSKFLKFELTSSLFGNVSGALGYICRKYFYPVHFRQVGRGVIWGKGCTWRLPGKISLGKRVAIDDHSMIDAGGSNGIAIGDDVIISRNCVIQGKTGPVRIGEKTDIGCNTIISSVTGVTIGKYVLIAGNCYIGGAQYISDDISIPMMEQGIVSKGPISIGDDTWLGAGVIVLDGVQIGKGCIIGAGAVVTKDLPDQSVAAGVPARITQKRN